MYKRFIPVKDRRGRNGEDPEDPSDGDEGLTPGKGESEGRTVEEEPQTAAQFWKSVDQDDGKPQSQSCSLGEPHGKQIPQPGSVTVREQPGGSRASVFVGRQLCSPRQILLKEV